MSRVVLAERMSGMQESATLALNARAKQLAAEGKTIYNLTAGELASDTPEYIQTAVAQKLHHNKYTAVAGLPELRQQIADSARDFYGLPWIQPEHVVVTAGVKPSLFGALLALINPGDEVIVPVPAWVSYDFLIELAGGRVVRVPLTETFDLDAAAIKQAITSRTKAIILNSPHNPTGAIFSKAALRATADILKGSGITVIADDIYSKLVFSDDFTLVPTCGFEQLIIVNGFSKSQALTGWRVGYIIAERAVADAVITLLSHAMGNAAVPSQYAALAALERNDRPPAETLDDLRTKRELVARELQGVAQLKYHQPGGAFYAFLDVRSITHDSAAWCEALLLQTGVVLVPGEAFGAPGFARLSFVADEAVLRPALQHICAFTNAQEGGTS